MTFKIPKHPVNPDAMVPFEQVLKEIKERREAEEKAKKRCEELGIPYLPVVAQSSQNSLSEQ